MQTDVTSWLPNDANFATKAIHSGSEIARESMSSVAVPIYVTSTYTQQPPPDHQKGYSYSRTGNPTRTAFERCLGSLEGGKYNLATSSGMSATLLALHLLKDGDHVISQKEMYHSNYNFIKKHYVRQFDVSFVDAAKLTEVEGALRPDTKLLWLETPTNPTLKVVDLKAVVSLVKQICPDAITVCDNTFLTPYFQRPLSLGVDIVVHSCTKYINGHSDSVNGFLSTNREDLFTLLHDLHSSFGCAPSAFDCYLLCRSTKTLELRMQRHMSNGMAVAKFLAKHPHIGRVLHPGLPDHPQFEVAKRQCSGHSGMLSFILKEVNFNLSTAFLRNLKLVLVADSLGGAETTIKMVSQMPKSSLTAEEKESIGISDAFMRLSVGLENPDDIIDDIDQALNKAYKDHSENK